jgi:hypothetical protein
MSNSSSPDQPPPDLATPAAVTYNAITVTFNWKAVFRLGLIWAAEYTMLALIEDSPELLKAATLICAVAGLAILQFEEKIREYNPRVFLGLIGIVAAIYLGFITYAVKRVVDREAVHDQLVNIYVSAGTLMDRTLPIMAGSNGGSYDDGAETHLALDADRWRRATAEWLSTNLEPAARERFLEVDNLPPNLCWGPRQPAMICDIHYGPDHG